MAMGITLKVRIAGTCLFLLVCIVYLLPSWRRNGPENISPAEGYSANLSDEIQQDPTSINGVLPLPRIYGNEVPAEDSAPVCAERYGPSYVRKFGGRVANYCDAESSANLTCFTHKAHDDRTDTFCIGRPATFDSGSGKMKLDCAIKKMEGEDLEHHAPQFSSFPPYWYNTGPKAIFQQHVQLERTADLSPSSDSEWPSTLLLIQREDNNQNMWHTMMEIMSLTFSLDVLRTNIDPSTGRPFFADADLKRSRIVFLDNLADGPYYDLWSISSGLPSIRLANLTTPDAMNSRVVVPLPGGSNPFWQGDWNDIDCGESALLKAYSRRVLDFYKVSEAPPRPGRKLRLTMIDRNAKRRLLDKKEYFGALQARYPDIEMELVNYASFSLAEQIKVSHATDILVGIHGAGLTHGMFLPPHATIVEILPRSLDHKGFKNMARFLGHNHFSRHGSVHPSPDDNGDWQHDDVFLDENEFIALMDEAIAAAQRSIP